MPLLCIFYTFLFLRSKMAIWIWITLIVVTNAKYSENQKNELEILIKDVSIDLAVDVKGIFTPKDVSNLLTKLNFKNCSENEKSEFCNLCYTYEDFMQLFNKSYYNQNLTNPEFMEVLSACIYLLTSASKSSVECKKFRSNVSNVSSSYDKELKKKYGVYMIDKHYIKEILLDINSTLGLFLNNTECFNHEDVLKGTHVSNIEFDNFNFNYVNVFIILQLIKKKCIKNVFSVQSSSLTPQFFINEILRNFGNETHITLEGLKNLLKKLKIGNVAGVDIHSRKKRSIPKIYLPFKKRRRRSLSFQKCFSAEDILEIFNINETSISKESFQQICPSLIQQVVSGYCVNSIETSQNSESTWKSWVATFIAIFVINVGSLICLFAAPIIKKKWFSFLLLFVISMAVGVLSGDAILHLLPHALGLHKHDSNDHNHEHDSNDHDHEHDHNIFAKDSFLWKCLLFLAGIYLFFVFEIIMHAFGAGHSHNVLSHGDEQLSNGHSHSSGIVNNNVHSYGEEHHSSKIYKHEKYVIKNNYQECHVDGVLYTPTDEKFHTDSNHKNELGSEISFVKVEKSLQNNGIDGSKTHLKKDSSNKVLPIKSFKSIVWMVFVGDAVHNFMDGVAIGTAFSDTFPASLNGGISTSIAILLHELPHELGNFAVLLASGLSVKQACIMHLISSITAFVGGSIGISLGTEWNTGFWILSVTAGLFIYVALVDMLPEVLHNKLLKTRPLIACFLSMLAMFIGFSIMFCLAAWEEELENSF
ncbi:zinc transporter ZIP10 isoform X1 [Hydra vulgaris]|uniref:zinc transporter ZIP10 isoform X1 n=1 Tax=Hydra vulgaris TaxID=6087 RepID=UPI000640EC31